MRSDIKPDFASTYDVTASATNSFLPSLCVVLSANRRDEETIHTTALTTAVRSAHIVPPVIEWASLIDVYQSVPTVRCVLDIRPFHNCAISEQKSCSDAELGVGRIGVFLGCDVAVDTDLG